VILVQWPWIVPLLWACGGLLLGVLVTLLIAQRQAGRLKEALASAQSRLREESAAEQERERTLLQTEERLARVFDGLARQSLQESTRSFLELARENLGRHQETAKGDLKEREKAIEGLVAPIREALLRTERQIGEIEKERHQAFGSISALLDAMNRSQVALSSETRNLVNALRRPEVRGQWGEMTLRRLVELAGMVEHCDFAEQVHTHGPDGALRPDMLIHLPENRLLVVDVKTPLDAYLAAVEAPDDATREVSLERHARKVRERVRELAAKAYWSQFERSPEFVILFIPGDQFLSAALSRDPMLLDDALNQHVILATPTSFVALLKAVAYGWRQVALAENARRICDLAADLYKRLAVFTGHLARMGQRLGSGVEAYNNAVGSLERQVLPAARRFTELGVQARKELEDLPSVEVAPRTVTPEGEDVLATLPEDETAVDRAPREAPPDAD
jgi:DNA recombination protein RmuC